MVIVKLIRNTYGGTRHTVDLMYHLKYDRETGEKRGDFVCSGGHGVDAYDPERAACQVLATRAYFGNVTGNPLVHYMVSFVQDDGSRTSGRSRFDCMQLAEFFSDRYQVFWALHRPCRPYEAYHAHFMANIRQKIGGHEYVHKVLRSGF